MYIKRKAGEIMSKTIIIYFSPTGTTEKIARLIGSGLNNSVTSYIDLCKPSVRAEELLFTEDDHVIMVFPVYAGRVVRIPRYYLKTLKGNNAKIATVVTYGNRAYDDALLELTKLCEASGFNQIAAAAFVCEHSFDIDIAKGRPDALDALTAQKFGEKLQEKFSSTIESHDFEECIPGTFPFKTQFRHDFGGPLVPETSKNCVSCGRCSRECPVLAIPSNDFSVTDPQKCITCFRCIRNCPASARKINLSTFIEHAEWLTKTYQDRKEPELFI